MKKYLYKLAILVWISTVLVSSSIPPVLIFSIPALLWLWVLGLSLFAVLLWLGTDES